MMLEFEIVMLTENIAESGLKSGEIGTIVMVHENGAGYKVEFVSPDGGTIAVETLLATQIRPMVDHVH